MRTRTLFALMLFLATFSCIGLPPMVDSVRPVIRNDTSVPLTLAFRTHMDPAESVTLTLPPNGVFDAGVRTLAYYNTDELRHPTIRISASGHSLDLTLKSGLESWSITLANGELLARNLADDGAAR